MKSKILLTPFYLVCQIAFCFIATSLHGQGGGEVINLGLFGGSAVDLTFCNSNQRLFAGVTTPASVFFTNNQGNNWFRPFPVDSLEFASGTRGWGGGGRKILTNQKGWVLARTLQTGGTLSAAVVSYFGGNVGTFKTAMDRFLLQQINPIFNAQTVTGIGLSDHYLYVGMEQFLMRLNDTSTRGLHNIIARTDTIPGIGSNYVIRDMAVANHHSGYPVYLLLASSMFDGGRIYKFDGTSFTHISVFPWHPFPNTVDAVFTHPVQVTGDTLIASIDETSINTKFLYLSVNGGASWTNITPTGGTSWPLHSVDYSPNWVAEMPVSNGLRMSFPGGGVSDDLGANWTSHVLPDNALATHPLNTSIVMGSYGRGVAVSTTGPNGPFNFPDNAGLMAVTIRNIHRKNDDFYVATNAGLGYTDAYNNVSVVGIDKWRSPHGQFPIADVGDDAGVSAVAISPTDPNHVVAGYKGGFALSTSGPGGFSNLIPTGWNTSTNYDSRINDIVFVTDQIVVAVSGSGQNELEVPLATYGNIWRSIDGGSSWSVVTPSGFEQGNTIAAGFANGDTVLYAGCGYFDLNFGKVNGQLWRSTDKGASWSLINSGPTGQGSSTPNMPIYDIDIHPSDNNIIYLASGENLDYALVRSSDGGATYNYINIIPHGAFSSVLVDRVNTDVISAAARRNLFRYNTLTESSHIVFTGLPGEYVPDLEFGSTLMGTTTGLYKLNLNLGQQQTIWNGDGNWSNNSLWSNGSPEYYKNVLIQSGNSDIDGAWEMNELIVDPGANLSLLSSGALSMNSTVRLKSNASGTASFINEKTGTDSQNAVVETYLTDGRWHYVSSPVSDAKAETFYFAGGSNSWLKTFDEENNQWVYITDLNYPLEVGKGYAVWLSSTKAAETAQYTGKLNKGDKNLNLQYNASTGQGWNLVGNPFSSALDWDIGNWNRTNTTGIAYVWNNGNYLTRNLTGEGTLTNGLIPSAQGFFVQATAFGAAITMPENARVHAGQDFYKKQNEYVNALDITVTNGNKTDKTWISFDAEATANLDPGRDALRLNGAPDAPHLYTRIADQDMSINILPELIQNTNVPLYFKPNASGNYTLYFDLVESFNISSLALIDKFTGSVHNIKLDPVYTFSANATDEPSRFEIEFGLFPATVNDLRLTSKPEIYQSEYEVIIYLKNPSKQVYLIEIIDLLGKPIWKKKTSSDVVRIPTSMLDHSCVVIHISDGQHAYAKKILIH